MHRFLLCLIPLFVAIDPIGLLPVFLNVTQGYSTLERRRLVLEAVPAAAIIGVIFFLLGGPLLRYLGLTIPDLQIAGGALLFVYAVIDLAIPGKPAVHETASVGIVPLATPLIAGPAVLTLGLVLVNQHGPLLPMLALLLNLALLAVVFALGERLLVLVPLNAMRAISKVVDLLLAAIGVSFVRLGVATVLGKV